MNSNTNQIIQGYLVQCKHTNFENPTFQVFNPIDNSYAWINMRDVPAHISYEYFINSYWRMALENYKIYRTLKFYGDYINRLQLQVQSPITLSVVDAHLYATAPIHPLIGTYYRTVTHPPLIQTPRHNPAPPVTSSAIRDALSSSIRARTHINNASSHQITPSTPVLPTTNTSIAATNTTTVPTTLQTTVHETPTVPTTVTIPQDAQTTTGEARETTQPTQIKQEFIEPVTNQSISSSSASKRPATQLNAEDTTSSGTSPPRKKRSLRQLKRQMPGRHFLLPRACSSCQGQK